MRGITAVGTFLIVAGIMILVLEPHYEVKRRTEVVNIEIAAPLRESRPIPRWVGLAVLTAGSLALFFGRERKG